MSRFRRYLGSLAVVLLLGAAVSGCATTADNTAQSLAEERETSEALLAHLRKNRAVVEDRRLNAYTDGIVDRIAAARPPGAVPVEAHLLADADVNAFTTGAGYLFINVGLLAAMENEAQVAMVVAHEIAHIDGGHILAAKSTRQTIGALGTIAKLGAAIAGVGGIVDLGVDVGAAAASSSFSRAQEEDADRVGFGYARAAGYDMREAARAFEVLARVHGSRSGVAAFLASHPQSAARQAALEALAAEGDPGDGRVGKETHDGATLGLRRAILEYLEAEGRTAEAAQIRKNLAE